MHCQLVAKTFFWFTGAVVGLEQTFFRVTESVGVVELCVTVSFPTIDCPITFPFDVILSTDEGTAGKLLTHT